jgi:hypothetical protein
MAAIVGYEVNIGWDISFPTITDLSAKQFYFGVLDNTGNIVVNSTAGGPVLGVIQDGPAASATSTRATALRLGGPTKVVCGGSFNPGDLITSDATGKAVKYTGATVFTGTPYTVSGSQVVGVALSAGASGDLATINFNPQGLAAAGLTA